MIDQIDIVSSRNVLIIYFESQQQYIDLNIQLEETSNNSKCEGFFSTFLLYKQKVLLISKRFNRPIYFPKHEYNSGAQFILYSLFTSQYNLTKFTYIHKSLLYIYNYQDYFKALQMSKTQSEKKTVFSLHHVSEDEDYDLTQFPLDIAKLIPQLLLNQQLFDAGKKQEREAYHNKVAKWYDESSYMVCHLHHHFLHVYQQLRISQQRHQTIREIFTISQPATVNTILRHISQLGPLSQFEAYTRRINLRWFDNKLKGKKQFTKTIKIAWVSQVVFYFNPGWSLAWLKKIFQTQTFFFTKETNIQKKYQKTINFLEYQLAFYLRSNILKMYKSGKVYQIMSKLENIKQHSLRCGDYSSSEIREAFQMTLEQALLQHGLDQYKKKGEQIESKYYKQKQQELLLVLNMEQQKKQAKKNKKKQKKVQQKKRQQENKQQPSIKQQAIEQPKIVLKEKVQQEKVIELIESMKISEVTNQKQLLIIDKVENKQIEQIENSNSAAIPSATSTPKRGMAKSTHTSSTTSVKSFIHLNDVEHPVEKTETIAQQFLPNKIYQQDNLSATINKDLSKQAVLNVLDNIFTSKAQQIAQQNQKTLPWKNYAYQLLFNFLTALLPYFSIQIFGSTASQVSLPNSDIDILITPPSFQLAIDGNLLSNLAWSLSQIGWVSYCEAILNAKIPVIKLIVDPSVSSFNPISLCKTVPYEQQVKIPSLIKFDISINTNRYYNTGIMTTNLMKNVFEQQPRKLMQGFKIIKLILSIGHLSEGYKGGISSYSLFIMLICFIQEKQIDTYQMLLSQLIMKFFQFYGRQFNHNSQVVNFNKGKKCFPSFEEYSYEYNSQSLSKTGLLKIIDPVSKNIIRASFSKYKDVVSLFNQFNDIYDIMLNKGESLAELLTQEVRQNTPKAISTIVCEINISNLPTSFESLLVTI